VSHGHALFSKSRVSNAVTQLMSSAWFAASPVPMDVAGSWPPSQSSRPAGEDVIPLGQGRQEERADDVVPHAFLAPGSRRCRVERRTGARAYGRR
jgi:hypothetical protein